MKRSSILIKFFFLTLTCAPLLSQKPNVVFILADDLGTGDISYNNKNPEWFRHTPNIDEICEQGIYFKNYSVHHVCSPTRAGLLTGMHYSKVGSGSETGGTLHNDIPNVAKDFKANGYVTGAFGKWHNGFPNFPVDGNGASVNKVTDIDSSNNIFEKKADQEWGEGVNAYGFDKWTGYYSGGGDYFNRYVNGHHEYDWWIDQHYRPDVKGYTTDLIGEAAVDFIENNKDTSFYCYVPMEAVHAPYHAKLSDLQELCSFFPGEWDYIKDIVSPLTGRKVSEVSQLRCEPGSEFDHTLIKEDSARFLHLIYSTMVYSMDKAIGSIIAKLEEHNLTENTIVVFSSDNGATQQGSNGIFQGSKHTLWEGGIHVPAAMWWPGTIDAVSLNKYALGDNVYEGYVQFIDYYPTIISLTNSTISATNLDGIDFSEGLLNRIDSRKEYESPYFGINSQWGVIKTGNWKLHYNEVVPEQVLALYDLDKDPGETANLTVAEPQITDTLKALYNHWVDENKYAFSYLPVSPDRITEPIPKPEGEILEVEAWQTDTIAEPFFVRFCNFSLGGDDAGDRVEFDIFVPDDSENDAGFHFSPGGGVAPYYVWNRAVSQDSVNLNTKQWPRNQWIRVVVGYGNHAPIGGYANYICLIATQPGYTHFYLDNMIVRQSDGSTQTIWQSSIDFSNLEYRYKDIKYKSVAAISVEGFAFSDVSVAAAQLDDMPLAIASIYPKNDEIDVGLTSDIRITFTKDLNPLTVENGINISPSIPGKETNILGGNEIVISHAEELTGNTLYAVTITSILRDISGKALPRDTTFQFTTKIIPPDADSDGVPDEEDNCPETANTYQEDADADGVGDVCEADTDGDGVIDDIDNCLNLANTDQADSDADGIGDVCDDVGISFQSGSELQIYPNPTENFMNVISIYESGTLSIYDLHGKLILTRIMTRHEERIDISGLMKGFYIIELENQGLSFRNKLIINK